MKFFGKRATKLWRVCLRSGAPTTKHTHDMKLKKSLLHGFGFLCLTCFAVAQDAPKDAPPPDKPAPPPARPDAPPPGGRPQGGPPGGGDPGARLAEFIKRADTDSDGKISKDEFSNMGKRESEDRFSKMDANSDGFVDQAEVASIAQNMRRGPEGQGMRRPGGEGGPPGGGEGGFRRPPGDGQGPRPDGGRPDGQGGPRPDGQSPGMRPGGEGGRGMGMFGDPKESFKRMDADANGTISEDEYIKATEKLREMMRNRGGMPGQPGQPGMRRPGGEGGPPGGPPGGGEGGFRRPPVEGDKPAPKPEGDKPKDAA